MSTNHLHPITEGISISIIQEALRQNSKRIFFLDYDGTLTPIVDHPSEALLSPQIKENILQLSQIGTVVVISGRDRHFLAATFENIPVHLIAEHGAFVKMAYLPGWNKMSTFGQSWQQALRPILHAYQDRCPGSLVEQKESSLAWHYRTAKNQDEATKLAKRLLEQLAQSPIVSELGLHTIDGNKVIEVKKAAYNKGTAAEKYIQTEEYDFVLAIGDDTTDEDMFLALPESSFTIKVGAGQTAARSRIADQGQVAALLTALLTGAAHK